METHSHSRSIPAGGWEFLSSPPRPERPPIQWVPGALFLGVKRPRRETDHSSPSSVEVKEWVELYLHSSNTPSWSGAQFKHRDNFTFNFYLLSRGKKWRSGRAMCLTHQTERNVFGVHCLSTVWDRQLNRDLNCGSLYFRGKRLRYPLHKELQKHVMSDTKLLLQTFMDNLSQQMFLLRITLRLYV
jgi:hypothetical protein